MKTADVCKALDLWNDVAKRNGTSFEAMEAVLSFGLSLTQPTTTKRKGWLNIYPTKSERLGDAFAGDIIYRDRRHADEEAGSNRVDCIEIEWKV